MSDSFFGFHTSHLSDDELDFLEEDRDDEDRLNSETFGADAGEWEEDDHEKIAAYLERERSASALHVVSNGQAAAAAPAPPPLADIERGLSKLVTDDELDDPCIMSVRRSSRPPPAGVPIPRPLQLARVRSPPVSSLLESDISGSPSTNSIWATTPTRPPPPPPPATPRFDDPAVMATGRARPPPPPPPPPPPAGRVRTVEELEQDLLAGSPARTAAAGPPPGFGRGVPPLQPDLSRPPPIRLPPPSGPGPGRQETLRLPNTQLPPPSVTSILPPQLRHKDRAVAGNVRSAGRGSGGPAPPHQQLRWQQEHRRPPADPHGGLMTQREQQWLLNIQRMQVKGNSDYYFRRLNWRKLTEGRRDSRGTADKQKDRDDKHTDQRNYKPPEMENSLGKLQVASVTAPRKIIDLGVINHESCDGSRDHKDAKRDRQTLLLIEQLYAQVLLLEEADRRAAGEAGGVSSDSESEQAVDGSVTRPEEARTAATARLWATLSREQHLLHILCVRKGKALVLRCIPVLNSAQYYTIASTLLKHLVPILHKDKTDRMMHKFFVCLQMVISNSDLAQITDLTCALTASSDLESGTPGKTPLQVVTSSPFGVSVLLLLLLRGDMLHQQQTPAAGGTAAVRWTALSAALVRCLAAMPALAAPLEPVPAQLLSKHVRHPQLVARLAANAAAAAADGSH